MYIVSLLILGVCKKNPSTRWVELGRFLRFDGLDLIGVQKFFYSRSDRVRSEESRVGKEC